jgi:uncharacterized membrane protein YfcA
VALTVNLYSVGALKLSAAGLSFLALLPAIVGMSAGQLILARVSPPVFQRCFFIGMLVLGAHQLVRSLL